MADYIYPASDYDKARNLLAILGSHWNNVYQGNFLVERYAYGRGQEELQSYQNLMEMVATISRLEVPLYHTDNWYMLTIKESELNNRVLQYGEGAIYGEQPSGGVYQYGTPNPAALGQGYRFPLPADLKDVNVIVNRLAEPSLTYTRGTDFDLRLDTSEIVFVANPFTDDRVPKRDVVEGSEVVDREAALWLFRGQFDWDYEYTHFGYVLGLRLESSKEYRDLVNAVLDALVMGTAQEQLQLALAAITGTPVVIEPVETVELVNSSAGSLDIVTNLNAYKFPADATAIVSVGDILHAGDQLVDTVTIDELNTGTIPANLFAVTMGLGFLPGDFVDGLSFRNADVPLEVETVDGKTKISFEVGGIPTDVDAFWDLVHEKGVASGVTLARYLDVRGTGATTEPTAASLPATINPLQFLIENVLRYNAYIVRIKASQAAGPIALSNTRLFRKIVPPWTAMLILIELDVSDDPVIMDGPGDSSAPGYEEEVSTFTGAEPIAETISPSTYVTETAKARLVHGICR